MLWFGDNRVGVSVLRLCQVRVQTGSKLHGLVTCIRKLFEHGVSNCVGGS